MKSRVWTMFLMAALFVTALSGASMGQNTATAKDVVAKVKEAAAALAKSGDVSAFNQIQSPWVWDGTYIFVLDCDKKVTAAHPMRPDLRGKPLAAITDAKGKPLYPDLAGFCEAAKKPGGVWTEYMWVKPGDTDPSRKINYNLAASGTPYVVAAGIFDDGTTIADLSKLSGSQ
jgi:cytochrome c